MKVGRGVTVKKLTTDWALQLDIARLARDIDFTQPLTGITRWSRAGGAESRIGWQVIPGRFLHLYYTITRADGQQRHLDYPVPLCTTPCYFGGRRWWFRCPECGRRCRILYLPPKQDRFACRTCHHLTYRSQQEKPSRLELLIIGPRRLEDLWVRLQLADSDHQRQKLADRLVRTARAVEKALDWYERLLKKE